MRYAPIYHAIRPVYGSIWRALRWLELVRLKIRYRYDYDVSVFRPGTGLHYKWLFESKSSGQLFLVKTTSGLIEWWQRVVKGWKVETSFPIDYDDLSFSRICADLRRLASVPTLKSRTLLHSIERQEIWYRYIPDARRDALEADAFDRSVCAFRALLESHGFVYKDYSIGNFVVCNSEVFLIDLESMVYVGGSQC